MGGASNDADPGWLRSAQASSTRARGWSEEEDKALRELHDTMTKDGGVIRYEALREQLAAKGYKREEPEICFRWILLDKLLALAGPATARRSGRHWTRAEVEELLHGVHCNIPRDVIAAGLRRSVSACLQRCALYRSSADELRLARHSIFWLPSDLELLKTMRQEGLKWSAIAMELGRSEAACKLKYYKEVPPEERDRAAGRWSVADVQRLKELYGRRREWSAIAIELGRSEGACRLKYNREVPPEMRRRAAPSSLSSPSSSAAVPHPSPSGVPSIVDWGPGRDLCGSLPGAQAALLCGSLPATNADGTAIPIGPGDPAAASNRSAALPPDLSPVALYRPRSQKASRTAIESGPSDQAVADIHPST
ncbi:unnamed protein product [Vitrella brassicaformis CCMP3155]|uniref:Myb-like domain-containing protein n=1 Tax=Vitrella brassicaformis (strain CCMP3155) TaxID=1169540 RepID=A0A0G4EKC1_VITBC|nr:unnamed protein product [Vitrella brassicaformis CCMP3155]|eukprot:CEL97134.1 unnamed protein product [Vitrella brassicaformis CCMP3155]